MDKRVEEEALPAQAQVALSALLYVFLKLGASSFGGGVSGWIHREIVERRQWLSDDRFLQAITIAQVMPGANPVNLAVYIGMQLRGFVGAAVAAFGMITPAFCIILLLGAGYGFISRYPEAHVVLGGLACAGIASTLTMGIKTARRLKGQVVPIGIAAAIFIMVGVLRWPLVAVVATSAPLSIIAAYWLERKRRHG
jgi:chromate transporter